MMNSIGMSGTAMLSPRAMMDQRIDAAVKAGSISATDETALDSALDAIDSALGVGSASGSTATSKLDPSQMGSRIDDLIDQQVKAGTLTDDQAATLQSLFAQNAPPSGAEGSEGSDEMALSGVGGKGGMRPMGPPPPPKADASDSDSDEDSTSTDETDASKQLDALIAFLENMRETMATKNSYATATTSASDNSNSGLIVDTLA